MCNDWNKILDFAITGNNKKPKQILVIENNSNGQ
jgi:hypothetical protein